MFKRNQVEEAIALVLEPGSIGPSMELCTRIKRLLDTDRNLGRNKRSNDPEHANFAFYSVDAEEEVPRTGFRITKPLHS